MIKLNSNKTNIWFTADTHFYHKNITKGTTSWTDYSMIRDFESIDKMTDTVINGINTHVKEDDILFHLGDWSFGGIDKIWESRKRITCKNIYLIAGNHDLKIIENKIADNYKARFDRYRTGRGPMSFSSKMTIVDKSENDQDQEYENFIGLQNLFNYKGTSDLIQIDRRLVYLSHFPVDFVRFDKPHYHVHGHLHGINNVTDYLLKRDRLDVGVDSAYNMFGEYRPFNWQEVERILNN